MFEGSIGTDALDRTLAVYGDPNPSAAAMLERLIADQRSAIMVLDNCPPEIHALLAAKVTSHGSRIKLITVEYDLREDKLQTTEVIYIEAVGPEVAEKLLLRRFPGIGQLNARRIAQFADGTARVSLVIAERVEERESLAVLSDAQLFDRFFEQRHGRTRDYGAEPDYEVFMTWRLPFASGTLARVILPAVHGLFWQTHSVACGFYFSALSTYTALRSSNKILKAIL